MSRSFARRLIILAAALTLTACVSATGPVKADCGGVTQGSDNCH
jgi:hypothetical protein